MAILLSNSTALAAVINTDARVSTSVQEMIVGAPGSATSDDAQLDNDLDNAPLLALSSLTSTDLNGALLATGEGHSEFADPTRLDQPNPEEFAIEVSCFSNAEDVAYVVDGAAEESRTIIFTTPGNPLARPEIEFGVSRRRVIESRFFLSGAIVLWSTEPQRDLTGMLSEFQVTVTRNDSGVTLIATSLSLSGDGVDQAATEASGPIRFETVSLEDLRDAGVDEFSMAVLQRIADEGTLIIVTIPPQEHPYTYTVTADRSLVLNATLTARVTNIPSGTGVSAVFGRPFENLAAFIDGALPGVDGTALQRSVNAVTAARTIGRVEPRDRSVSRPLAGACGAFGPELAAMLALGFCPCLMRPRRR